MFKRKGIRCAVFAGAIVAGIIASCVLLSEASHAQPPAVCIAGADLAENTARLRDRGVSLAVVRKQMVDSNAPEEVLDAMLTLADAVYNEPKLTPREVKRAFMQGCTKPVTKGGA